MINPLRHFDSRLNGDTVPPEFSTFIVIVPSVEFIGGRRVIAFGEVNSSYLEVILSLTGCVRAEEEAVDGVWFAWWSGMMSVEVI